MAERMARMKARVIRDGNGKEWVIASCEYCVNEQARPIIDGKTAFETIRAEFGMYQLKEHVQCNYCNKIQTLKKGGA